MIKKDFVCRRCGACCKPLVIVTASDIGRIKSMGYSEDFFVMSDGKKKVLRNDEKCIFLGFSHGKAFCRVYSARPRICRKYPFFGKNIVDCRPKSLFPSVGCLKKFKK
jgi:Fe-S-cluster containining protein